MSNLNSIWFWQRFISPHKSFLADEIGSLKIDVNYVANDFITNERKKMGWKFFNPRNVNLYKKILNR